MPIQQTTIIKLRHNRTAWVAHCRAVQSIQEAIRKDNDGMSHGIIPFGAVHHWADIERERLANALSAPIPERITGWDESGVGLSVVCPYCQWEHRHIVVPEAWQPEEPLKADCGKGAYLIKIRPGSPPKPAQERSILDSVF